MKVYELIKKLEEFDQDDEVMLSDVNSCGCQATVLKIIDVKNIAQSGRVVAIEAGGSYDS